MIAVANSGPLIYLSHLGKLNLLNQLFDAVLVPQEVYDEVVVRGKELPGSKEVEEAVRSGTLAVEKVRDVTAVQALVKLIGHGESQAIILAYERKANRIVMDDRKARGEAVRMGLKVIGTLGLLRTGRRHGLIDESLEESVNRLEGVGFYMTKGLRKEFLKVPKGRER